ncbi:MAG TPA: PAS domain-containing sensor histidine kinase [Gemmatimonadaceae bacterium]|jgi:PAS domain S-box-containing protein|nr:PAS domain-containing sensor histidine kinase [Gemmatimonadaceae bacterium]
MDRLLDQAPCGFLTFAGDGTVLDANRTLIEMLGAQREEVIGRPFESLLTVSSRIFYQTHLFPLLKLQSRVEELFLTLRNNDGGDVAVLTNVARREEAGAVVYDAVLMRLLERRRWEDEVVRARRSAEEANRATSGLLSMMSHDLRTPIGSISGYCDLLLMGVRGPLNDAQAGDVQRMKKVAEYLLGLIEDVLNFARLRSGQIIDLDMKTIDTETALSRTEALIGPRMEQARIEYHREGCTPDVKMIADPDRLQQILLNLITNAVKFTAAGGRITIWCRRDGDQTLISVADTGRGIAADQLERIFEPFVQASGSAGDPAAKKGFGLGLAISRGLARRMGGDLTVTSEQGVGSTFTLRLASPA